MSTSAVFSLLLVCLTACVSGYSLHMFDLECPANADVKLHECLSTMENIAAYEELLPENCRTAMEAMSCSKRLLMACMDNASLVKVLGNHDLSVFMKVVKPICTGK